MDQRPYIFLTHPSHGHTSVKAATMSAALACAPDGCRVAHHPIQSSLLTHNFNCAWGQCLNDREKYGFTHFAMLHSDVIPLPYGQPWLDQLVSIQEDHDADLLSVVVPIKNDRGLTSTAIDGDNPWCVRRLTLAEVFRRPPTWTEEGLLVNTGCWVARLGEWCDQVCFRQQDRIFRTREGRRVAATIPEDWDFSRQARDAGARVYATRQIAVIHEFEQF